MSKQLVKDEAGFTLVELAIVLVIIGLIIGGVLVGQDLIKAAEIRSTISQVERYNASVNAFRDKYRYLPGDIPAAAALNFGFVTRAGTVGQGDGNTLLEGSAANATVLDGETTLFWRDLYEAQLIENNFSVATDAPTTCANPSACKAYMPDAKMGRGNFLTVYSQTGKNFFHIIGINDVNAGAYTVRLAMSPQEAFNIDAKIDDSLPLTGGVRAYDVIGTVDAAAAPAAGICVTNGSGTNTVADTYNTGDGEVFATTPACGLRIRMN